MPKAIQNFLVQLFYFIQMMNLWDQKVIPGRNYLILLLILSMSVNTELPINSSHGSEEEEFDFLHLYEELSDYDFHRMMSVDDFTYSTAFSN